MKTNCYKCKWCGNVPGSAHICCNHPSVKPAMDNPMMRIAGIFSSVGRFPPIIANSPELNIKGNPFGIARGWFNFPFDFDPVWLDNCDGFELKEVNSESKERTS